MRSDVKYHETNYVIIYEKNDHDTQLRLKDILHYMLQELIMVLLPVSSCKC